MTGDHAQTRRLLAVGEWNELPTNTLTDFQSISDRQQAKLGHQVIYRKQSTSQILIDNFRVLFGAQFNAKSFLSPFLRFSPPSLPAGSSFAPASPASLRSFQERASRATPHIASRVLPASPRHGDF
jgi:hypothetical protein